MNKRLLIYDIQSIEDIKTHLSDYEFVTLTLLVKKCNNTSEVCALEISQHAIDLTTFFFDTSNSRWHKGALEEYVIELLSNFDNIVFILNANEERKFRDTYPFLFSEDSIQYFLNEAEDKNTTLEESNELVYVALNEIYTYNNSSDLLKCSSEMNILIFSQLIKDFNGISANFDFEKIKEDVYYFIDITTLVEYLRFRRDQVFVYEMIFNNLVKIKSISYLIQSKSIELMKELFPFMFNLQKKLDPQISESFVDTQEAACNVNDSLSEEIDHITRQLENKLNGHDDFKEALKLNLIKYKLLNKIGKRSIMSIFICGKSGVGKTEFAKSLSQIMYPNDKLIKINFGNYSSEGVLNSLIGSPLGYKGSEKGGELINKVSESGTKVILIDEFEKADEKVFNFFYELLEDGKFTDREGKEHNLDGYIIVFTSNLNTDNYHKKIPEPLHSRFDMKYFFTPLEVDKKWNYIHNYSEDLIQSLEDEFDIRINKEEVEDQLIKLVEFDNIREIKRRVEDVIISEVNYHNM